MYQPRNANEVISTMLLITRFVLQSANNHLNPTVCPSNCLDLDELRRCLRGGAGAAPIGKTAAPPRGYPLHLDANIGVGLSRGIFGLLVLPPKNLSLDSSAFFPLG